MLDGTYSLNDRNMPVYILMAPDTLGYGRIVAAAIVSSETTDSVANFLRAFKRINKCWASIETIIIDKDSAEIAAIRDEFKGVNIFLCYFHILKAFLHQIGKSNIHESLKENAIKMFREMAFSTSEIEYEEIKNRFIKEMPDKISDYFLIMGPPSL